LLQGIVQAHVREVGGDQIESCSPISRKIIGLPLVQLELRLKIVAACGERVEP
jgi:hypothetical protein